MNKLKIINLLLEKIKYNINLLKCSIALIKITTTRNVIFLITSISTLIINAIVCWFFKYVMMDSINGLLLFSILFFIFFMGYCMSKNLRFLFFYLTANRLVINYVISLSKFFQIKNPIMLCCIFILYMLIEKSKFCMENYQVIWSITFILIVISLFRIFIYIPLFCYNRLYTDSDLKTLMENDNYSVLFFNPEETFNAAKKVSSSVGSLLKKEKALQAVADGFEAASKSGSSKSLALFGTASTAMATATIFSFQSGKQEIENVKKDHGSAAEILNSIQEKKQLLNSAGLQELEKLTKTQSHIRDYIYDQNAIIVGAQSFYNTTLNLVLKKHSPNTELSIIVYQHQKFVEAFQQKTINGMFIPQSAKPLVSSVIEENILIYYLSKKLEYFF